MKHLNKEIIDVLPSNLDMCKEMLELLGNNKTIVKLDKDIKNSYYVFLNDTIYLSNRDKVNKSYYRISLIAHECMHSVQNKVLQIINFIFSNIELITFLISLTLILINSKNIILLKSYLIINIVSIIPRLMLEIHATIKSIKLSTTYLKDKIGNESLDNIIKRYRFKIILFFPLFILSLIFWKILRLALIYFLM